jgi:beta-aspartyl-peptidase (threonine type)
MLHGKGAEELARLHGLAFEPASYFYDDFRHRQWQEVHAAGTVSMDHRDEKKFGTVGAVARDVHGNLAAATSTGGMTNKKFNRIGDTPVIGSGTYANNLTCAVSCTGHGEYFLRQVVAYDISCLMEYKGLSLEAACQKVVMDKLVKLGGEGGVIAVDGAGNASLVFNSAGMYRGLVSEGRAPEVAIYR